MFRSKPGIVISILGVLLLLAPTVSAQTLAPVSGAVTVLGEGSASAPAEQASVVITIGPDTNVYIDYSDPDAVVPEASATPSAVNVTAVIDAIVAYGIPVEDVILVDTPFMGEWGSGMTPQPATILVTVTEPTVEGLSDLLEAVRTSAQAEGLFVNNFGVMYSVADCRALRQEARANAVAIARDEAEDQAAALDITVGDVVASRDTLPMNMGYFQTNSCNTTPVAIPYSITFMAGQFDPGMPAEVMVFVAVEVSFDIP